MNFFLEAGDQFAVGGDQCLLGFDLGDDGLLRSEWWEWNFSLVQTPNRKLRLCGTGNDCIPLRPEVF